MLTIQYIKIVIIPIVAHIQEVVVPLLVLEQLPRQLNFMIDTLITIVVVKQKMYLVV